jgi:hypothetical protein
MANGRRRDEWDRFGQLLSLIWDRTNFAENAKSRPPIEFWPPSLIEQGEAAKATRSAPVTTVPMSVIQKMVLG